MDNDEQVKAVAQGLRSLVAGTRRDQLDNQTPCEEWKVRDLIGHFVGGGHAFAALLRGEAPAQPEPGADPLGADHLAAFDAAIADFEAGAATPGAMERTLEFPFGAMPAPVGMQLLVSDLLVHSWDLATATGQPFSPPEDLVAGADAFMRQMIPAGERTGMPFAPPCDPPAGASALQRLVAYAGRRA
jgi:uncharacterized protein (TIGR03086 family)